MKNPELAARPHEAGLNHWLGLLLGLMLLSLLALPAFAAESQEANDPLDPPGRAGRVAEVEGQVWVYDTEANEWIQALRNRPITTGDRVSTEADGHAEVRIGSTVLHLSGNAELEVSRLDDNILSLRLHGGSLSVRLRNREAADEFVLQTDEGRFRATEPGLYRFDRDDGTSAATALSGQAEYEADGTALTVQQGQRVEFWKERGAPQYSATSPARDAFTAWVASREPREAGSTSTRYVSAEMTGVEDLDRYGRWEQSTDYGPLWIPRQVAPGWAPYRMGHWAWVRPWGWTWVDDAPWGFAPFHYGRWVWHRNNWCWTPGRYVARPVYAPALVAWVGGPVVSVSVTVGSAPNVGWFPLGPREVYVPGYRVSPRYVRNVNVTHVTRITNVNLIIDNPGQYMANARYVNRGSPRAVTIVPSVVVARRQPVAPALGRVNERVVRDFTHERPRAQAPVAPPPRWVPGTRPVADPRTSRPGFAPAVPSREGGNDRAQRPPERDRRERDRPVSVVPVAPPHQTAPTPPRWIPGDHDGRGSNRGAPPQAEPPRADAPRPRPAPPRSSVTPPQTPPRMEPRPIPPDRSAPPPADERKRHHEMPGPPRNSVAAPPARVQATQPAAPVVRPPAVVQQRSQPAPPRANPPPADESQRGRDNRDHSSERGARAERERR